MPLAMAAVRQDDSGFGNLFVMQDSLQPTIDEVKAQWTGVVQPSNMGLAVQVERIQDSNSITTSHICFSTLDWLPFSFIVVAAHQDRAAITRLLCHGSQNSPSQC
jgi:hypothetical protein